MSVIRGHLCVRSEGKNVDYKLQLPKDETSTEQIVDLVSACVRTLQSLPRDSFEFQFITIRREDS